MSIAKQLYRLWNERDTKDGFWHYFAELGCRNNDLYLLLDVFLLSQGGQQEWRQDGDSDTLRRNQGYGNVVRTRVVSDADDDSTAVATATA